MPQTKKQSDSSSHVFQLSDMIDYQTGSIVSRTLFEKNTDTVTLFSFAEGQGLSEHTSPFDAMVYILDGEAEVSISSKSFHLHTGEMIVMSANRPHALKAVTQFKMMLILNRIK